MAYTRVNWENLPSTNTPVNATNLNKMDAGIATLDNGLKDANSNISSLITRMTDAETNIEQVSSKKGKILWTNPSYTTEFPAQKIDLDLSKYTCIRIIYTNWAGSWSFIDNGLTPITSNGILGILNVANTNNRRFAVSSTGVEFQAPENNGDNRNQVPIHIIGYENW